MLVYVLGRMQNRDFPQDLSNLQRLYMDLAWTKRWRKREQRAKELWHWKTRTSCGFRKSKMKKKRKLAVNIYIKVVWRMKSFDEAKRSSLNKKTRNLFRGEYSTIAVRGMGRWRGQPPRVKVILHPSSPNEKTSSRSQTWGLWFFLRNSLTNIPGRGKPFTCRKYALVIVGTRASGINSVSKLGLFVELSPWACDWIPLGMRLTQRMT